MRFNVWQRWHSWVGRILKPAAHQRPLRRGESRLLLEVLETREMPAMVIVPTFAANINADPAAATIKATINEAINVIETYFTNPITVHVTFQEGPGLGTNLTFFNTVTYTAYRAALVAHASTPDDATALASLPAGPANPVNGGMNMDLSTPLLRALGLPGGAVPMDSTIILNTAICNLSRAGVQNPANYDLLAVTSHELDEVLGFGSALTGPQGSPAPANIEPDDLYRYSAPGVRSYDTLLATTAYYSIDGGVTPLASFNQDAAGDFGDWLSNPPPFPEIQDAFGTPGATADLGVELRRLDVVGYTRVAVAAPVVTTAAQGENPGIPTAINLGSFTGPNTGPWSVTVVWGDASPNTTFFVTNRGALGTLLHTYPGAGPYTATVTVTDYTSLSGTSSFEVAGGSTLLSLDASNNLDVTDISTNGKNDNLTIQADAANSQYIISDPSAASLLVFGSAFPGGHVSANQHFAYIPFADVTGPSINVDTLGGNDKLTIDTSLGAFSKTINFDGGAGANILVGPDQNDTWNITGKNTGSITGLATFINVQELVGGSGADDFRITAGGVSGLIAAGGQAGDTLDYSGYNGAGIVVNLATGTATLTGGISGIVNAVGNANRADILTGTNVYNIWTLTANNSGTASTFNFTNFANLIGGAGQDVFNLNGFTITGSINGGGGSNTLFGPDHPTVVWVVTGINRGDITGVLGAFVNIQNLTGGDGQDIFVFDNGATLSGQVDGGDGNNWLDYAAFTRSIVVNLQSGTDSAALGGVVNFNNILGSAVGGDHLTGNANGGILVGHGALNTLYAGSGASLLIGGYGRNFLIGGASNDILINGSTKYDSNINALQSILSMWQNNSYYTAMVQIQSSSTPLRVGSTVTLTPATPTIGPRFGRGTSLYESALVGNGGLNWFFTTTLTSIADRKPGEVVAE